MKSTKNIFIYIVDNDIIFADNFASEFKYREDTAIEPFSSVQKFLAHLRQRTDNLFTVVIINDMIISHGLNTKSVVEILPMIKNIDKTTSVIVLTDNDNLELKMSSSDLRPDAFVKNDNMLYLKLVPTINRIVCRYELKKKTKTMRIAIIIAVIIITITIVHIIIASFIS